MKKTSKKATGIDPELERASKELVAEAADFVIDNDEKRADAQRAIKSIKEMKDRIIAHYEEMREATYEAYQTVLRNRKSYIDPLDAADKQLRQRSSAYYLKRENERKAEEAKRMAEAQKKADDEKLEQADELHKMGRKEEAEAILNTPTAPFPEAPPIPTAPQTEGVSYRANWKWRIVDIKKVPDNYKKLDEKAITGVVKAMKENTNIPGIEVFNAGSIAVK